MNRVFDPIDIVFIVLISLYLIVLITIGLILWYQKEQRDKLKLEKMVTDREKEITKEITQKVTDEVTQKVTDEVTVAIALKMIKDGLPKQQVINYLQITEEEYETLKRKVFDK